MGVGRGAYLLCGSLQRRWYGSEVVNIRNVLGAHYQTTMAQEFHVVEETRTKTGRELKTNESKLVCHFASWESTPILAWIKCNRNL